MKFVTVFTIFGLIALCTSEDTTELLGTEPVTEPATDVTTLPTEAPTTVAPVPTTVAPTPSIFYQLKNPDTNVNCIMFAGDFRLDITYENTEKKKKVTQVRVPGPSAESKVSGSCGGVNETAFITVQYGSVVSSNESAGAASSFTLKFNLTGEDTYQLKGVEMSLNLDSDHFSGSPDIGKQMAVKGALPGLSMLSLPVNSSLSCRSNIESSDFTGQVADSNQTYVVTADALGFQLQAFNAEPNDGKLAAGKHCTQDTTSDLVPIAVGCALAALVLLVLISYLIGRRRRASSYESV